MAEKKRPSVSNKRRVAPPQERASSSSAPETAVLPDKEVVAEPVSESAKSKPAAPTKRRSISDREKKKAAKAKIVVPPAKKEPEPHYDEMDVPAFDFEGGEEDAFIDAPAQASSAPCARKGRGREEGREEETGRKQKRRSVKKKRLWPKVLTAVVILIVVAVVGSFSAYRWMYGDDAVDMLGAWNVPGGDTPIMISSEAIVLTDDVSYEYELDTDSKTVSISFGQMEGWGYYHFSPDRNTLFIVDGQFTWMDTLESDISWVAKEIVALITGGEQPVPEGENAIVLVRTSASV